VDTQNPSVLSIFPQAFNLRIGRADAPLVLDVRRQTHFDALLLGFDLHDSALDLLDTIVRGADTDQMGLSPQSAGLLAFSLGLSRLHAQDDHAMLEAAMPLYDALYAWCRDRVAAQGEAHNWKPETRVVGAPA
jgi:hypothetical protein